jgi:hypothetical protein
MAPRLITGRVNGTIITAPIRRVQLFSPGFDGPDVEQQFGRPVVDELQSLKRHSLPSERIHLSGNKRIDRWRRTEIAPWVIDHFVSIVHPSTLRGWIREERRRKRKVPVARGRRPALCKNEVIFFAQLDLQRFALRTVSELAFDPDRRIQELPNRGGLGAEPDSKSVDGKSTESQLESPTPAADPHAAAGCRCRMVSIIVSSRARRSSSERYCWGWSGGTGAEMSSCNSSRRWARHFWIWSRNSGSPIWLRMNLADCSPFP